MKTAGVKVDQKASFINFVYPFLFEPKDFSARMDSVGRARWEGRGRPFALWKHHSFPEDDLLLHVASYLNPPEGTPPTACLWELERDALQSPYGLGSQAEWRLITPQEEIPFSIEVFRLTLFRVGVGFVTVGAKPIDARLDSWLNFLHYFRFAWGKRKVGVQAQRRIGIDSETHQPTQSPYFPEPAGGITGHPEGKGYFGEIVESLLETGRRENESKSWWREVFVPGQLIPFTALFVDGLPDEEVYPLVYRVRNFFHAHQEIHPTTEDLLPNSQALLPYAKWQWFVFSLDGGGFLACNAPSTPFFRQTLPAHLVDQYSLLFLLTLHQRFALMMLSEDVAKHWLTGSDNQDESEREEAFERIRDGLLSFTARGHFTQVMQQEHHHRCYHKWQEVFQVSTLYKEVSEEVKEMYDYLQMRRTERLQTLAEEQQKQTRQIEKRISLLGVCIGIPMLISCFLSINLIGLTTKTEGLTIPLALLITICGGGVLSLGILWLLRRGPLKGGR